MLEMKPEIEVSAQENNSPKPFLLHKFQRCVHFVLAEFHMLQNEGIFLSGIPVREDLMLEMKPEIEDYSLENGYMVTKEFLEKKIPCTAIYVIIIHHFITFLLIIHRYG